MDFDTLPFYPQSSGLSLRVLVGAELQRRGMGQSVEGQAYEMPVLGELAVEVHMDCKGFAEVVALAVPHHIAAEWGTALEPVLGEYTVKLLMELAGRFQ